MSQPQVNVNVPAVGSNGINTEDSPISQDHSFVAVADNAVIDKFGRIGGRKAFATDTVTFPSPPTIVGAVTYNLEIDSLEGGVIGPSSKVLAIGTYTGYDANGGVVGRARRIFERSGSVLTVAGGTPTINDDSTLSSAQIVATDDRFYIFSEGNEVLVWNGTVVTNLSADGAYIGIDNGAGPEIPTFDRGMAAYGRIWATGHEGDSNTVYYSDLLIGSSWYTTGGTDPLSTAGKINVLENWPNGRDEIVGIAAHNNMLIVFGREAILVYNAGYGDPADRASGFTLQDTISNVGCVARDAIVNIGTDVLFVDDSGVRSLARTIQERSSPMGNLTVKVRGDITSLIAQVDSDTIKMVYDGSNNFALVLFESEQLVYCLDLKLYTSGGVSRVTRWTGCGFKCMEFIEEANTPTLLLGGRSNTGVLRYEGYTQHDSLPYLFKYYSNPMNFGEPAKTKIVKQVDYTIISGQFDAEGFAKYGYDNIGEYKTKRLNLIANPAAYYGEAIWNEETYGASDELIRRYRVNTGGSGESLVIGLETEVLGNTVSLQEINVQTLIGRIN